jgi:hypothetical protein
MPYFIYQISETPFRRLALLEQHEAFRDASNRAKQLRGECSDGTTIKVIFAETELHAEDLLNQVRAATPNPQDD